MHTTWEKTALQQAADQVVVRGSLKSSGIAATIFGALALLAGVSPPADALLIAVGAALALVGLWNLTNPSPIGLALTAGALVLVGLYNIGSGFLEAAAGTRPWVGWQVLGVWQIVWGFQGFGRWRRFQGALANPVSEEHRSRAKTMIDELRKTNAKKSPDVIELVAAGFTPRSVRARLMPDLALVLVANGEDVQLATGRELEIETHDAKPGKTARVTLRLNNLTLKAVITAENLRRYQAWKQAGSGLERAA